MMKFLGCSEEQGDSSKKAVLGAVGCCRRKITLEHVITCYILLLLSLLHTHLLAGPSSFIPPSSTLITCVSYTMLGLNYQQVQPRLLLLPEAAVRSTILVYVKRMGA